MSSWCPNILMSTASSGETSAVGYYTGFFQDHSNKAVNILGHFKQQELFSHDSGSQRSEMKVLG